MIGPERGQLAGCGMLVESRRPENTPTDLESTFLGVLMLHLTAAHPHAPGGCAEQKSPKKLRSLGDGSPYQYHARVTPVETMTPREGI